MAVQGIVLNYDTTIGNTEHRVKKWLDHVSQFCREDVNIMLVEEHAVQSELLVTVLNKDLARVSCHIGENTQDVLECIVHEILDRLSEVSWACWLCTLKSTTQTTPSTQTTPTTPTTAPTLSAVHKVISKIDYINCSLSFSLCTPIESLGVFEQNYKFSINIRDIKHIQLYTEQQTEKFAHQMGVAYRLRAICMHMENNTQYVIIIQVHYFGYFVRQLKVLRRKIFTVV
jgi:hypothetical protein